MVNGAAPCSHAEGCWLCSGPVQHGAEGAKGVAKTFLDNRRCHGAPGAVCAACMAAMSKRQFTIDGAGRAAPANLSHWGDDAGYCFGTKSDKARILGFLTTAKRGRWFAAIADSGQKHVLPFAQFNVGGGVTGIVSFETETVLVPPSAPTDAAQVTAMLNAGVSKTGILSGEYLPRQIMAAGVDVIDAFESWAKHQRGSGWFSLVVWLAQKGESLCDPVKAPCNEEAKPETPPSKMGQLSFF